MVQFWVREDIKEQEYDIQDLDLSNTLNRKNETKGNLIGRF